MGVARRYIHHFQLVSGNRVSYHFGAADPSESDYALTANDQELFILGVVPMITLGDARLGNIDRHLSPVSSFNEFGERPPTVDIHLQWIAETVMRQITQIRTMEFFCEWIRHIGDAEVFPALLEGENQLCNLTKGDSMYRLNMAKSIRRARLAIQCVYEVIDDIVNINQIQRYGWIVDRNRKTIGNVIAKSGNGAVVVWSTPLSEDIRQAVDIHWSSALPAIGENGILGLTLANSVRIILCRLGGRAYQQRSRSSLFDQVGDNSPGQIGIATGKFCHILRAVDTRQVEDKVRTPYQGRQFSRVVINIKFGYRNIGSQSQRCRQVFAHKAG